MSGVAKAVKKVFKKIKEDPLKAIITIAVIWWTAGTAMNYFAAPELGMGAAASAQTSSMWTSTTEFFAASAAEEGLVVSGVETTAVDMSVVGEGAMVADPNLLTESLAEMAAEGLPSELGASMRMGSAAVLPPETGMFSWMKTNPMATMMLGQGGMGAYQGYLADKAEEREQKRYDERGLMGFDRFGKWGGVANHMPEQATTTEAVQAPTVPIVQAPTVDAPSPRNVKRSELPQMQESGQIARR